MKKLISDICIDLSSTSVNDDAVRYLLRGVSKNKLESLQLSLLNNNCTEDVLTDVSNYVKNQ